MLIQNSSELSNKINNCYIIDQHSQVCTASSTAFGVGACAITGNTPASCKLAAVVGPIATTYIERNKKIKVAY